MSSISSSSCSGRINLQTIINRYPVDPTQAIYKTAPRGTKRPALRIPGPYTVRRAPPPPTSSRSSRENMSDTAPRSRSGRTSLASLAHPTVYRPSPAGGLGVQPVYISDADRNARSKLVAGILLHRVHAVGKPMRRRSGDVAREYIRSGLSCEV